MRVENGMRYWSGSLLKKPVMLCRCRTTLNASATSGLCPLPQPQTPSRASGFVLRPPSEIDLRKNLIGARAGSSHGIRRGFGRMLRSDFSKADTLLQRDDRLHILARLFWLGGERRKSLDERFRIQPKPIIHNTTTGRYHHEPRRSAGAVCHHDRGHRV